MRLVAGILILAVSSVPAAAQYVAPLPVPAAPTPAAAPAPIVVTPPPAPAVAVVPAAPAAPIYPPGSADFHVNGAAVMDATPLPSPEQQRADADLQAAWQARCRPTVVEDRDGVSRVRYADEGCDLSPFNTAGGK
jgi:hypothetical protein